MGIFGKTENKPAEAPRPAAAPATPSYAPPAPAASPAAPRTPAPAAVAAAPTTCVIGAKTHINGEVSGDDNVVVEGTVEGKINIAHDLRVGPGGRVKANVTAQSVVVAGELVGDCQATQRVQIEATGKMTGNIRAPRVVIVEGATFRGNSDMSGGK